MPVDTHPSNSILTIGSTFQAVKLAANSRVAPQYTITATVAAVINAISLTVTSNVPVTIYANTQLTFGATTVVVTADTPLTSTASPMPILPAPAAITANATATTFGWASMLGIQDMSEDAKSSLISIRSMASGLYNDQRVTMIDQTLQFSGWYHQKDSAMKNVIKPCGRQGGEVFFQASYSDGEIVRGVGLVANLARQAKLDDVQKYTWTLNCNDALVYATTALN